MPGRGENDSATNQSPTIVKLLVEHPAVDRYDHASLRYVIYAGAPMYRADQKLALRKLGPAHVVIAVPTAPPEASEQFKSEVDDIICAITPEPFYGVGFWYDNFEQTTDAEVRELLRRAAVTVNSEQ